VSLDWKGDKLLEAMTEDLKEGMGFVGLKVQGEAQKQLFKGHGVITGTLRRSIHTAPPSANWSGDTGGGEGMLVLAEVVGGCVVISVGSGIEYAMAVHQGHHSFAGYHYLVIGLDIVAPEAPMIIRGHMKCLA